MTLETSSNQREHNTDENRRIKYGQWRLFLLSLSYELGLAIILALSGITCRGRAFFFALVSQATNLPDFFDKLVQVLDLRRQLLAVVF